MSLSPFLHALKSRFWIVLALLFAGLSILWLIFTPAGITGKLLAIAYAVCEQNPTHTLSLGGRVLFLCSRCTGMYLGTGVAMAFLTNRKKALQSPSKGKKIVLAALFLAFAVDGINSTAATFFPGHTLYQSSNILRFITGMGMGIVIANVLLPLWNQTFWAQASDEPVLSSWPQLAGLILVETLVSLLVLTGAKELYFPVAILSTVMVPVLLTMVYSLLFMVIFKRENLVRRWNMGIIYIEIGAVCALLQIGLFDLIRFSLTGIW